MQIEFDLHLYPTEETEIEIGAEAAITRSGGWDLVLPSRGWSNFGLYTPLFRVVVNGAWRG